MKRLVIFAFLLAMIGTQFAYGQKLSVNEAENYIRNNHSTFEYFFYADDETIDKAYEAPNSALIKKWYTYPMPSSAFRDFQYGFIEFKKNGTLLLYQIYEDFHTEITGTWQRSKLKLNTTVNYNTAKLIPNDNLSLRKRDEINKKQANLRKNGIHKMNLTIKRLDKALLFEPYDISWDFSRYLISEEYLNEKYLEEHKTAINEVRSIPKLDPDVYDSVDESPQFVGGLSALFEYLSNNIQYPKEAEEKGIQGRVLVTFVVEKDGSISNAYVTKGLEPSLEKEALRVINTMPNWKPGKKDGVAVRTKYTVPVSFKP